MSTKAKKFDKVVVDNLILQIEKELKKPRNKRNPIKLSLKENNVVKFIDPSFSFDRLGEWNGWGYKKLGKHLKIENFLKTKNALKKIDSEEKKETETLSEKEKIEKWAKRLDKLTGCGFAVALEIAREKIDFALERLERTTEVEISSSKIPAWFKKAEREYEKAYNDNSTLLKHIKNAEHANAILIASDRHNNTDYDVKLEKAKELKAIGEVEDVKEYARLNFLTK